MRITVGSTERRARSTSSYVFRMTQVNFAYTVTAADFDADGIAIPANSIVGGAWFRVSQAGVGLTAANRNHAALANQAAHKVHSNRSASISATSPASLTEATLHTATVSVALTGDTFAAGVLASHFEPVGAIPGLTVSQVSGASSGSAAATLTLSFTGDFSVPATLAVRVKPAALTLTGTDGLTTATVAVAPTDEAPSWPAIADLHVQRGVAMTPVQLPAATGGNGALDYSLSGALPAGMKFDATGADANGCTAADFPAGYADTANLAAAPRVICGTPTGSTNLSVTPIAHDADANRASSDSGRGSLIVFTYGASVSATSPSALTEASLNGATVTVALEDTTFAAGVTKSSFALVTSPAIAGLTIGSVSGGASGSTTATLTLAFTGGFDAVRTLAVRVKAAAHQRSGDLATGTVAVTPTPGIALGRTALALEEDPAAGGGTNAHRGTYTLALAADPTPAGGGICVVNVEVASNNPDVTIDTDQSPLTKRIAFDGSDWSTAQTVTVTAAGDADGVDDVATISHRRVGGVCAGGFFGRPTLPAVTVTVNDDETPGAAIASPSILTAATLNGAAVTVSLDKTTFASGVGAASFELVASPAVAGLSVGSVSGGASGSTSATLNLSWSGTTLAADAKLKVRVLAAAHAGDTNLETGEIDVLVANTAPSFPVPTLSDKHFPVGAAIRPFQIPAASGGNGALSYTVPTLIRLPGLKFDVTGTDADGCPGTTPRVVCGTPTVARAATLQFRVQDADSDRDSTDEASLTVDTYIYGASISSTSPSPLTEATLNTATVTVSLANTTFGAGVTASSFELVTNIPNVSISGVSGGASGSTTATLTLAFTGDFSTDRTLAVKVKAAAHARSEDVTTGALTVPPAGVTNTAPSFPVSTLPDKHFPVGAPIEPFQIPAATGGNGALSYTVPTLILLSGLKFDVTGTDTGGCTAADFPTGFTDTANLAAAPRVVCGTPTVARAATLQFRVQDADSDRDSTDEASLTVDTYIYGASISSTSPSPLTEVGLNGATVTVSLVSTSFASGVSASSFELVTDVPNVSISQVSGATSGSTTATLTLAFTGNISTDQTLAVKVKAAAHARSGDLTTDAVTVAVPSAAIASTLPTVLTAATLNGAAVTVSLDKTTFASGVGAASFELAASPAIAGLSVGSVSGGASGSTSATLNLSWSGTTLAADAKLKVRVLAAAHAGDANLETAEIDVFVTNTAPSFPVSTLPDKHFPVGAPIEPFQIPAATGGNGALSYTVPTLILLSGLKFDVTGTDTGGCTAADFPTGFTDTANLAAAPRVVCGTPTVARAATLQFRVQDADSDRDSTDEASLTVDTYIYGASISSTSPSPLTEANLNTATVAVSLAETTFGAGVTASSFELVTDVPDVSISGVSGGASGSTTATLTLAFTGDFGTSRTLAVKVKAAAHARSGDLTTAAVTVTPTDTAPAFARGWPATGFPSGAAIVPFQLPAASGGNGAVTYAAAGLPAGLKFDATGADAGGCTAADFPTGFADAANLAAAPRVVCGTPARDGASIVVVTAHDADANRASTDRARLSFTFTVAAPAAALAWSLPPALTEASLHGATLGVSLRQSAFAAGAGASGFALVTTVPNLSIARVSDVAEGGTTATLTLAFTGDWRGAGRPLAVRVLAAAHRQAGDLTTAAVTVPPAPGLALAPATSAASRLRTTEAGDTATFTVRLDRAPSGNVVLDVTSSDTGEGTVAPARLTFTPSDWNTAQTVTLTGVDDAPTPSDPNPSAGNRNYTVSVAVDAAATADAGYDGLAAVTVYAVNADDEYGLEVGAVTGQATEAGGQSTFTVALRTQPSAAVTVAVTSRDEGEGTVEPASLTFAAAAWNTGQTVTVTGVQDPVDDGDAAWQVRLDPASGDADYAGVGDVDVDVTTADDDGPPGVTLALDTATLDESGAATIATVTARLSHPSGAATTVTVSAGTAWTAGSDAAIVIAAGATANASDTATVVAADNATDEPDRTGTVTATIANDRAAADSTTMAVTGAALTVRDDDAAPGATLALAPASVTENGGIATVTATLSNPSSEPSTVTVAAVSGGYTVGTDATITIAAGATTAAADTVLVTAVDDSIHQGSAGRSVTVTAALANGHGAGAVTGAALTLSDDETLPTVALVLSSSSITETGGIATVTATLSGPSSAAVTVTVAAAAGSGAVAADFDLSSATTLTFAAGATTSAGLVTVTANGNVVDSPNKSVTVSGTAAGGNGVVNPPNVTLTLEDDDALPTVALALSASSITETGGISTVTATLSGPSSAAVTVTVAAAAGAGAVAGDFTLSTAATLTFAAGSTTSAGVVTVTANGNAVDSPNKSVTVSGTAAGGNNVANPPNVTLTLEDDDALPTVALALSSTSISETGGVATVTATLSGPSSAAVTVTVGAAAGAGAVAADFALSTAATLTFAAGATASTGVVTVTANGNDVDSPNKTVTVSGAAAGGNGVSNPPNVTLTLTDDDALPTVALALSASSITETGGIATVTARLSGPSSAAVTVTVAAAAGTGAVAADFTLSSTNTLTIAAGATTSAGEVTVTANGNAVDSPNKTVTVSGTAAGGNGVVNPPNVTLTLTDDDALPTVSLALMPSSIAETNGVATVTATLSGPSSAAVTVTVAAAAGTGAVAADFTLSGATTLTIAAGSTESAGLVTVTANGNDVDSPDKPVTVSGTAAGGNGVADPPNATLTLADDDALPTLALVLTPAIVGENGGVSTVTATLSGKSSAAVTLTVSAAPVASTGAVAGDFALSSATTLTIAAGATVSAGAVTVMANDNAADEPDVEVRVSAAAAGGNGVAAPPAAALTIRDDEGPPTVTLVLTPSTIDESGTGSTAAVTATLNRASSAATTITVSVAPVASTGAAAGDYALSSPATLTIAAGATTSSGTVTVAAVDDDTDAPNKQATVSGAAVNDQSVQQPIARTLTIADDDAAPDATLALSSTSISENGGVATVTATLSRRSAQATTVTVQGVSGAYSVGSGAASRIVIAAGATSSGGGAALTAVDNDVDAADRQVTVTAVLANGHGVGTVSGGGITLTLTDDDTAGLAVDPATSAGSRLETTESAGTATFTVKLATEPTGDVEIGVASSDTGEGTVGPSTLAFTTADWSTAQTVTLTGVDDAAADGNRDYTVTLTIDQTNTADANYDALPAVTVYARNRDDEFGLNVSAVSGQATEAAGGMATFTVALRTQPTAAVTVSVSSRDAGEGSVSPPSLTFTTGGWNTAQTVTVTGVQDTIDDGTVTWAVRLDPASGDGDYDTSSVEEDVSVTTTDDDGPPGVTLALNPSSIAESGTGNAATVTARLSHASGAATTVTVTAVSGLYAPGTDAAIVIPAGSTQAASDTATVVAVDNATDAPDRAGTVTAAVTNARAAADGTTMSVTGAALTVRDDDPAPGVTLALDPASVSENGGVSTVTATLSRPSSEPSTVTVTAVSGAYTVGTDATITIAAGATTAATDTVLVTAVDDNIHQGTAGRSATVTAALANGHGAGAVTGAALALTDDESLPTVALVLTPASIPENGGLSTVTATLTGPSSAAVTVTVSTASSSDYTQTGSTLTIAAGATTSAGLVTVRGTDNAVASGSRQVTVSATSAGGNGVANPPDATLTITDDDTPRSALVLSSNSIAENGGVATVTATLDRQSTVAVTVTVAATAVSPAVAGDFTQTGTALTFAANATTSTGLVTMTAVNNTTDAPNKSVTISGTASDSLGQTNDPPSATLAITDDDAAPTATLALNPASIAESGTGSTATVSATLSHPSSQPSTVTVTAAPGAYTVGADSTIVIAAGATTAASDTATVTAVNDDVHQGSAGRSVTVTASLANGQGAGAVTGAALTITDDETLPTAALVLGPASISENGGVATVTAELSGPSSAAVTVTVAATAGTNAVAGDFTLSTATTLTIAAGSTTSAGVVTVTGVDNNVDVGTATKSVTVSAMATGGNGVAAPSAATLTITDDEATATATLVLTPAAILENEQVSTVTARLSHPTTEAVTLTVAAAAGENAVSADFTLSTATTLTIAAGSTVSAGTVTVQAHDNSVASGRKRVTVSATAAGGRMVAAPSSVTLIIRDDEYGLNVSAVTGQATEAGGTATFTVALNTQPSASVTVAMSSRDADGNPDPTEGRVAPSTLTFTVQNWNTAQTVTVTGVDDNLHDGNVTWQVRLTPSSGDADYNTLDPVDVDVTTTDATPPTVTLMLEPASIPENGGVSTVTATLSHPSSADTTVTVEVSPGENAVAGDYTLSMATMLTIAATATKSTGVVTITARNNDVDADDKTVTVSVATVGNSRAEADSTTFGMTSATLTIADDDDRGFAFVPEGPVLAAVGGAAATYTAKLTSKPTATVTVSISIAPDDADLTISPSRLTFTPSDWSAAQTVTVTAQRDDDDLAEAAALAHTASGGGYGGVTGTLPAAVSDVGDTRIATDGAAGETIYYVNRRTVTVTVAESVREDVVAIELPPDLDRAVTVTVAPLPGGRAAATAGSGYGLGPAESRVAVDVDVSPVPPGGLRQLCLRVTDGLRAAAKGRELILLRDGEPLPGRPHDDEGARVCAAGVASFSPFAVGYADTKPEFPEFTMTAMVFTVDDAIAPVTLPAAKDGDSTSHELLPKPWVLPPGLRFDEAARVLSGTPTEAFAERRYVWTATDVDGEKDELAFTIEVIPALGLARERLAAVNRSILPELARATWGSVVDAVTERLESPGAAGGGGPAAGLAGAAEFLRANERALGEGSASWKELLAGESFAAGLGPGAAGGGGGSGSPAVAWGSGDWRRLALDKGALDWSGDLFAAHVGIDAPLGGSLRGGLAASWIEGEIEYTDRSGDAAIAGVHESRLAAVHPYLGWSGADGARLWGVLGYGEGEIEIAEADLVERFGVQKGGSAFAAAAAGGSVPVVSADGLVLALKGSGEATRYSVKDNGSAIAGVSVKTQRLRVAAAASRTWALAGGGAFTPALEVGARWDGGDGETGAGMELGGGLEWVSGALSVEAQGRALVAHEGDVEEWGVSGSARLSPGSGGRGLSLALSPRWGASESGLARLWDEGMAGRASSSGAADAAAAGTARLEAELGYGFGFWEGTGVMTPHAGFGYEESGARRYRLGTRFAFGPDLAVGLQAERKEGPADPEHGARLELRLRW